MINKSFVIIMFCYSTTFCLIGVEWMILEPLGLHMTNPDGTPINSQLVTLIDEDAINEIAGNVIDTRYNGTNPAAEDQQFDRIWNFNPAMAYTTFQAVGLLTGTHVFHILTIMGVPYYFTWGLIVLYLFFLVRTIAGMLRGF